MYKGSRVSLFACVRPQTEAISSLAISLVSKLNSIYCANRIATATQAALAISICVQLAGVIDVAAAESTIW